MCFKDKQWENIPSETISKTKAPFFWELLGSSIELLDRTQHKTILILFYFISIELYHTKCQCIKRWRYIFVNAIKFITNWARINEVIIIVFFTWLVKELCTYEKLPQASNLNSGMSLNCSLFIYTAIMIIE